MLPSGAAGKSYIEEVTRLMKLWINDTLLRKIVCLHKYYRNHLNSQTSQNKKIIMLLSKEDKSYERKGKLKSCITKDKQTVQKRLKSLDSSMTISGNNDQRSILMISGNNE